MNENTYPIVLRDEDANILIAEVKSQGDINRLLEEYKKLNEESYSPDRNLDFYGELSDRTWINIYYADVYDI